MTEREAYDRLARTPRWSALQVGRHLSRGYRLQDLAAQAQPTEPPSSDPFVTPACPGYPPLLHQLLDRPLRLFHRGRPLSELAPHCVAVVGSRNACPHGLWWSRRLGHGLTTAGITVCSGLALGIDAEAHRGALACQEATKAVPVGVLGHGWHHLYPPQNLALRQRLEREAVLLTEYPASHPPSRWTFPERNRIIAGLSQTVVVVEASQKSGSLHTARFALDAGRDVWVVPTRPGAPNSAGVLSLLRDGAAPLIDLDEFLEQLTGQLQRTYPTSPPFPDLTPEQWALLHALAEQDSGPEQPLNQNLGCSPNELAQRLSELELLDLVRRQNYGGWALTRWDILESPHSQKAAGNRPLAPS